MKTDLMERPHVVILGAGASRQAFPKGDRYGQKLPLMDDLVETLGLGGVIDQLGLSDRPKNFEQFYSQLSEDPANREHCGLIEGYVRDYFSSLEMPEQPTIYDHLVLSLRDKDVIATFNWDPFLFQACARNWRVTKPPTTLFLHGNVVVGFCSRHNDIVGHIRGKCSKCGERLIRSPLLYPIAKKNYTETPFIREEWRYLREALKTAYVVTIFGYGAPQSDVEAVSLMKEAWGSVHSRNYEQVEVIDIKHEDELLETWKDFIHTHHYMMAQDFYDSWIPNQPRRTCEAVWDQTMECEHLSPNPVPREANFEKLWNWFEPIWQDEKQRP